MKKTKCIFVSDLHGSIGRYEKLFSLIADEKPNAVFMGGDLLPNTMRFSNAYQDFLPDYFFPALKKLKNNLKDYYPEIFIIPGNDDPRIEIETFMTKNTEGIFHYINQAKEYLDDYLIFGYGYVPPTPFQLKDWEKYDVSRYVDPGCIHPYEGFTSVARNKNSIYETIKDDLEALTINENLSNAVFLFHSPPYQTYLDRAALDGNMIDHVPLDVNVGSIAIKRFILERQPLLTLHGHIHESTRITGHWFQQIGHTFLFNAAHDGKELSAIIFFLEDIQRAVRKLL
jgi:uncharacterized protein